MELFDGISSGFEVALTWTNLLYVTIGVLVGTVIGLLPGLGPVSAIALLLPMTFGLDPTTAVVLLAGIYYGSMYGGRIPSILLGMPGDASSVITTLDGYPLTQQGRGGPALGITAIGSFVGGTVAILGLTFLAPALVGFATAIGPPEMFMLAVAGILLVTTIGTGSKIKGVTLAGLGILLATVGIDTISGQGRFTLGSTDLLAGVQVVPLAVGLFGLGEILYNSERRGSFGAAKARLGKVLPSWLDLLAVRMAVLRASILGFFIGILPGGGGVVSSVLAYGVERNMSKDPDKFGKGAIDGLAATETADNASSNSAFIPLLTLGLPPNPVLALIFGALVLHGITPGPQLMNNHPDIFWGVIASMYVGNILLLILNLPLVGAFVQLLRLRPTILSPIIVLVAVFGVYSMRHSMFDVIMCGIFGVLGYLLRKLRYDLAPLILGFILGPILEAEFRRSLLMSNGDPTIFIERPFSLAILLTLFGVLGLVALRKGRRRVQVK